MITKARIVRALEFDPWYNLAVEEFLLDNVSEDECILYLWQNQNTIVIGKKKGEAIPLFSVCT
jgi:lipoate-protein ligase A